MPKRWWLRLFKRYGAAERSFISSFLDRIEHPELERHLPNDTWSQQEWAKSLLRILDDICSASGFSVWVEKTPMHLYFTDLITLIEPQVKSQPFRSGVFCRGTIEKTMHPEVET